MYMYICIYVYVYIYICICIYAYWLIASPIVIPAAEASHAQMSGGRTLLAKDVSVL